MYITSPGYTYYERFDLLSGTYVMNRQDEEEKEEIGLASKKNAPTPTEK